MLFHHRPAAAGIAIISRYPLSALQILQPPPGGWFPGMVVQMKSPHGVVQLLNLHLRPAISDSGSVISGYFSTGPLRRNQISAFIKALDPKLPTIIAGDFNEDCEGAALQLLKGRGFQSVLPRFAPQAKTWRWNTLFGTIQSRLDHICYGKGLEPLNAEVLQLGRSDHLPVIASFLLKRR